MSMVPPSIQDITADWLTVVLGERRLLKTSVTGVKIEPIGAGVGLMGELGRLQLTYAGEEELPSSIVAKCAAQNENRQIAQVLDFYTREADFYNRLASDCPLRVPVSFYADVNPASYDFILLMEDLGEVSVRDQLVGAAREEVFSAVKCIAGMHARWWGISAEAYPWMYEHMSEAEGEKLKTMLYMPALEPTIENFAHLLDAEAKQICRTVGDRYVDCWGQLSSPDTFVHGDYRQDNMLYSAGQTDALVMDWQISGRGKGAFDVAYFMCQSVDSALRAEIEEEVLEYYVETLAEANIHYALDDCREDYRRAILGCMVYPITVCGTLDTANERGRALGECMLSRNLTAIRELDCLELLS